MEEENIHIDVTQWQWSTESHNNLHPIELHIEEFGIKLKEKMIIDRQSANFLKLATQIIKSDDMVNKDSGPFLLKLRFTIAEILSSISNKDDDKGLINDLVDYGRLATFIQNYGDCEFKYCQFKEFTEAKYVPREVMKVTKEVKNFIKDAVRVGFELSDNFIMLDKVVKGVDKFSVPMLTLDTSLDQCFESESNLLSNIPKNIDITVEADINLISEEIILDIADETSSLDIMRSESEEALIKLKKKSEFMFYFTERKVPVPQFLFEVDQWILEFPDNELSKDSIIKSLESHLLEEELEKGLEFRITPPFMDDTPPYTECKSSLGYSILNIPKRLKIPAETDDPLHYFHYIASGFNEGDLIGEKLEYIKLDVFEDEKEILVRLVTTTDYIIYNNDSNPVFAETINELKSYGNRSNAIQRLPKLNFSIKGSHRIVRKSGPNSFQRMESPPDEKQNSLSKGYPFPDLDAELNTSLNSLFGRSDFLAQNSAGNDSSNHFDDSLHVTKMATTFVTLNDTNAETSLTKRSLDYELDELIAKKRKISKSSNNKNAFLGTRIPLLEYLHGDQSSEAIISENLPQKSLDISEQIVNDSFKTDSTLFDDLFSNTSGIIGLNLSYIHENQNYLRLLEEKTASLSIRELEMDKNDVDFLINPQMGILIIPAMSLEQLDLDGNLIIEERFLDARKRYLDLYVILSVPKIYKRYETLVNFLLVAIRFGIHPIITTDSVLNHCEYISKISSQYSFKEISQKELNTLDTDAKVGVLLSCGVNQFAAFQMLKKKSLLEIISMSSKDRLSNFPFLSPHIEKCIDRLVSLKWSIST